MAFGLSMSMFITCGAGQRARVNMDLRKADLDNNAMDTKGKSGHQRERHQSSRRQAIGEEKESRSVGTGHVWGNEFGRRVQALLAFSLLVLDSSRLEVRWPDATNPSHSPTHLGSLASQFNEPHSFLWMRMADAGLRD